MGETKHRLNTLQKLRDCLVDARAFAYVSGDHGPATYIAKAIECAEAHEPADSFKECLLCGVKHQRVQSRYCCFECAKEDGAVMK